MKIHYQAYYVRKKEESRALCNDSINDVVTTTDLSKVDCKRCIKLAKVYHARGAYDRSLLSKIISGVIVAYAMVRYRLRERRNED